jgi:hypothetical protein
MVLAIFAADEGCGFGVAEDLFGLRIEAQRTADTSGIMTVRREEVEPV